MRKIFYFFLALALFNLPCAFGQTLGTSFEQTVSVASVTAYSSSHVAIEYNMPRNATGCIVRFATKSKGESFNEPSLSSLVALLPKSEFTQAYKLAKFALGNSDDNDIDFEVLTTAKDANAFTNTFFKYYNCLLFQHTVSSCFYLAENLNDKIYFAINNRNYFKGVNVKVEVIPVYANSPHSFTLQLHNTADSELKFDIQYDGDPAWYSARIDGDSYTNFIVKSPRVRLRIATNGVYKTRVADTYQRQWLKWDNDDKAWDFTYD